MIDFLRRAWRYTKRTYASRNHPSTSRAPGPLQQVSAIAANRASGVLGAPLRAAYTVGVGMLKVRERMRADRASFDAQLRAPVAMPVLRNAALWQASIVDQGGADPVAHVNLHVLDRDRAQVDRVLSVLLLSEKLGSISFFFDDAAALAARHTSQTLAEERSGISRFNLNSASLPAASDVSGADWPSIFSGRNGFGGGANHYLKVACPGAYTVALSLPETEDGFCQLSALLEWQTAIRGFRSAIEPLCFVLLNAVPAEAVHADQNSGGLRMARTAGLSMAEAIRLAQQADAYVGATDVFGLAARGAGRPGVYGNAGAAEACRALREILEGAGGGQSGAKAAL